MTNAFVRTYSRKGPDVISEELAVMFSRAISYEFKPLFLVLQASLRARKFGMGGEEMLRLRVYEKLQNLVSQGVVKKTVSHTIKTYQGIPAPLRVLSEKMKAFREEWAERLALKAAAA